MSLKVFSAVLSLSLLLGASFARADEAAFQQKSLEAAAIIQNDLLPGINACFNPSHPDGINDAKRDFSGLLARISSYEQNAISQKAQVQQSLHADLARFSQRTSFPVNLECGTVRACLTEGFKPDAKYPNCKAEYLEKFNELLDQVLPEMINSLN
ncbi:MAG: hypothetical protein ACXVAX_09350 [Pseudobdellovibrio sp.]